MTLSSNLAQATTTITTPDKKDEFQFQVKVWEIKSIVYAHEEPQTGQTGQTCECENEGKFQVHHILAPNQGSAIISWKAKESISSAPAIDKIFSRRYEILSVKQLTNFPVAIVAVPIEDVLLGTRTCTSTTEIAKENKLSNVTLIPSASSSLVTTLVTTTKFTPQIQQPIQLYLWSMNTSHNWNVGCSDGKSSICTSSEIFVMAQDEVTAHNFCCDRYSQEFSVDAEVYSKQFS